MNILETQRVVLREFSTNDADALCAVLCDPETMRYYPARFDRNSVNEWITRNRSRYAKDGHGLWALVLKARGELIGDCGLVVQEIDGVNEIEIGYHVRRDLWGQGLATEAARACRDYGFANLAVNRLVSIIRPENVASCRVAEKSGMYVWKKEVMRVGFLHVVYSIRRDQLGRVHGSAPGSLPITPRGKPLLHGERRRRRHILPLDQQFSLGAARARQRDLEGFDRRRRLAHGERSAAQFGGWIIGGGALANAVR